MFSIHGVAGRVFRGSLEQLKALSPTGAAARARRPGAHDEPTVADGSAASAEGPSQPGTRAALAAYASAGAGTTERHVLSRVADVMSPTAHTLDAAMPLRDAWRTLAELGHGQAPVVDAEGALVGLFVLGDLLRNDGLRRALLHAEAAVAGPATADTENAERLAWRTLLDQPVQALMRSPVPATVPETDLRSVAGALLATGLPGLPVTDDGGRVRGFVARGDILRAVAAEPPLDLWG